MNVVKVVVTVIEGYSEVLSVDLFFAIFFSRLNRINFKE